jgi:DNA-binding response OmpR family regulator
VLRVGDLTLDPATGSVARAGRPITLPRKERALLELFMRQPGRLFGREEIVVRLWDGEAAHDSDIVRAHVRLLRKAIGDDAAPRLIETVYGLGYRLADRAHGT